jgi:hypothetical protein
VPTSDEDLQKKRDEVQKLRDKVATANADADRKARELDNDVAAAQLDAEKVRLENELAAAKHRGSAAVVKAGVAGPLHSAQEAMRLAEEQRKNEEALREADKKAAGKAPSTDDDGSTAVVAKQATTEGAPDAVRSN